MPSIFKMSDDKTAVDNPTIVIAESQDSVKRRSMKKYVIITVCSILAVAIILTAILVGMWMFTEAQKEIVKYTLNFDNKGKQEVTSDPNTNIVQYHISNPGQEAWVVNDFNRDIQVVKIQSDRDTKCYVSPLNRSIAMDPSKIVKPEDTKNMQHGGSLIYTTSNTPISDTSFLSKVAKDTCAGTSMYWVYPQCKNTLAGSPNTTDVNKSQRTKRDVDNSPYYYYYQKYYNGVYLDCFIGCCEVICACVTDFYWSTSNGQVYCTWYTYNCPPYVYADKVYDYYCDGPRGLSCPYYGSCFI